MFAFGLMGSFYLILASQLHGGFPPFYRRFEGRSFADNPFLEREFQLFLPAVIGMSAGIVLLILTGAPECWLIFGAFGFWGGWRMRRDLAANSDGPRPWITNIWISNWAVWTLKRPMLVFDVWTMGLSLLFSLPLLR